MSRAQSETLFARTKLVLDLEHTLHMLPLIVLRVCGFRYVGAQERGGVVSPACVLRYGWCC